MTINNIERKIQAIREISDVTVRAELINDLLTLPNLSEEEKEILNAELGVLIMIEDTEMEW